MPFQHVSVLLGETVEALTQDLPLHEKKIWTVTDATIGGAGHTSALVRKLFEINPEISVNVQGYDQDAVAIAAAGERLAEVHQQFPNFSFQLIHGNFRSLASASDSSGQVDLFLADLGMSSPQLDDPARGFSSQVAHPPDMRMDFRSARSAADLLRDEDEVELARIFREYADEPRALHLARKLVAARQSNALRLDRSDELARFIDQALGYPHSRKSPAIRIFQALRIAVNDEVGALGELLNSVPRLLELRIGRAAFISFHSIEDRMVKVAMRRWESQNPSLGVESPRGGVVASDGESSTNTRSRSARLRVFYFGETRRSARERMRRVTI